MPTKTEEHVDALVVGAGFGGIYQTYALKQKGFKVRCIERGSTAGGVWFWNRYPGAMSDTESHIYRYSWDKEDLKSYPWSSRYLSQAEILAYLNHVVDKHNLRSSMQFNTELQTATWDEDKKVWRLVCNTGDIFIARYLITALGGLSQPNFPKMTGIDSFSGRLIHTQDWPEDLDLTGKKVGVIGSGSTGLQLMTAIAPIVGSLVSFQRSPQYSVPSGQQPISEEQRKDINENYDEIYDKVWNSGSGYGLEQGTTRVTSVPPEERKKMFEALWARGNAFRFNETGFCDISTDIEANRETCNFIRGKIDEIVKDPRKARILKPTDLYNRRPLCDSGYYQIFNRDNVDVVSLRETPIDSIVPEGIRTSDGKIYELDVLVFATGFDAIEGSYSRIHIQGRDKKLLSEHWANGPRSYAGVSMPGFPNMFSIFGPQGPMSNGPCVVEVEVNFIMQAIEYVEACTKNAPSAAPVTVEVKSEAEAAWLELCNKEAEGSLMKTGKSWLFGTNIPGRKPCVTFYFPGLKGWLALMKKEIGDRFPSYTIN